MSEIAVSVENLGKLYEIGQFAGYLTLRDVLTTRFRRAFSSTLNHPVEAPEESIFGR